MTASSGQVETRRSSDIFGGPRTPVRFVRPGEDDIAAEGYGRRLLNQNFPKVLTLFAGYV
jgi:hypothetical protein